MTKTEDHVNDSWRYIEESHRGNTTRITLSKYSEKVHDFCAVEVQRQKLVTTMKKIYNRKKKSINLKSLHVPKKST